ncbi:PdmS protein [Thozetella sp. PMI_491]|nr:PdmS protein [Thozetella sp. PMI_491]
MRVLIATQPYVGHFNPTQPVVIELMKRGHEVVWLTGQEYQAKVVATGARFEAMSTEALVHWDEIQPDPGTSGTAKMVSLLRKLATDRIPAQVADYQRVLETFDADILFVEWCTWGAHTLHDLTGLPYVTLGINPLVTPDPEIPPWGTGLQPPTTYVGKWANDLVHRLAQWLLHSKMEALINQERKMLGLGPLPPGVGFASGHFSKFAHIMLNTPAVEFPRKNLSPSVKFVGPLIPAPDMSAFVPPAWWDELLAFPRDKVVHVTQGTIAASLGDLAVPTVRALAARKDLLVVVTGKNVEETFGVDFLVAPNMRTAAYVPHALLLPYVGVMVSNGGYQGVLAALSFGVPLVCAGRSEDKADTSSRVAWSGAGIDLRTSTPSERAIGKAVAKILGDKRYRVAAEKVMKDFRKHDGPVEAVDIIEQVVKETKLE